MGAKTLGVLCGGSGSSKFASAIATHFSHFTNSSEMKLGFVTNVADNFWRRGIYVCPDIDIITYALSGRLDTSRGWGVFSDTHNLQTLYGKLASGEDWFNLGDLDLALCLRRTKLLKDGWRLSRVTEFFQKLFGITYPVIPSTDDSVQTFVKTASGLMHLQEFWVKNKGELDVLNVGYLGIEKARANIIALKQCEQKVVICPANPVTSISPIVKLKGFARILKRSRVIAISPFLRGEAFSGPAPKFLRAVGCEASSYGVARMYSSFLKVFLVDSKEDLRIIGKIKDLGIECVKTKISVRTSKDQELIAKEIADVL